MIPLTDDAIRASFINASRSERKGITLPPDLGATDWDARDFLGWRDPQLPLVGYVVVPLDGTLVGVVMRQTESRPNSRAQCSWCTDVDLPNDVLRFSARRVGDAGRRGDTVGTLACAEFQCNQNARRLPRSAYLGFDVEAARQRRIETTREHVEGFVRGIRDGR